MNYGDTLENIKNLRIGNLIATNIDTSGGIQISRITRLSHEDYSKWNDDFELIFNPLNEPNDSFYECDLKDIRPVKITEEYLQKLGFEKIDNSLSQSFYMKIEATHSEHESISISRNSDQKGLWYLFFRQGDKRQKNKLHQNDLVCLRNNLKYIHELQNIVEPFAGINLSLVA